MKLIPLILSLTVAVCARAEMVRVVSVDDARTLTVERNGQREQVRLAGIDILDAQRATELLRWTVGTSWVLVEPHGAGGNFVWRSPDGMFVNRELVLRGYARPTEPGIDAPSNVNVTYLGEVDPPLIAAKSGTDSGTYRRSPASPSPSPRRVPRPRPASRTRAATRPPKPR